MSPFEQATGQTLNRWLSRGNLRLSKLSSYNQLVRGCERLQEANTALRHEAERLRDALAVSRAAGDKTVLEEDYNLINSIFESLNTATLAILVERAVSISKRVLLVGKGKEADNVAAVLREMGREVKRVEALADSLLPDGDVVLAAPAFSTEHYEQVAVLRERSHAKVYTIFQLFGGACLFRAVNGLIGYHVQPIEKMLSWTVGTEIMAPLIRLNERYPLRGKRVIEFGPLDGAMSGNLIALGVASLGCVEVRMANVLKLLAAKQYLGWKNVDLIVDDMHTVDGTTYGRWDLVVAHGVYYHSVAPFRFLKNLATLADTIYLGGYCANPSRLRVPLVTLEYEGHQYRAQPFHESLKSAGAGVHPAGYYFLPDDLIAFVRRLGFDVEVIDLDEAAPHKAAGYFLRALLKKRISSEYPTSQAG